MEGERRKWNGEEEIDRQSRKGERKRMRVRRWWRRQRQRKRE